MQEQAVVKQLTLSGNDFGDGFLLILNGVLGASAKFNNRCLESIDLSACNIAPKIEHGEVIAKVFETTGVKVLDLTGNRLQQIDVDDIRSRARN